MPVVFLSGDEALCQEVKEYNEGIRTVATMRGLGPATISIHPSLAITRIREGMREALSRELTHLSRPLPSRINVEDRLREAA